MSKESGLHVFSFGPKEYKLYFKNGEKSLSLGTKGFKYTTTYTDLIDAKYVLFEKIKKVSSSIKKIDDHFTFYIDCEDLNSGSTYKIYISTNTQEQACEIQALLSANYVLAMNKLIGL